jgi:hypothetical protein
MTRHVLSQPTEEACAVRERHTDRSYLWRLALGVLGLFWVCVLVLLMR